jgi:L-lactate dehydrogenase complex protein LldG
MSAAREEILRRIRHALRDDPRGGEPIDAPPAGDYRRVSDRGRAETVTLFAERVSDYQATVRTVRGKDLPAAIALALDERGVRRLAVPADVADTWLPNGIEIVRDDQCTADELDAVDGVLTGCALGIAQTGTIVLDGGAHQGRRAITLVPDYHLCIVSDDQIVELVPEAIERLGPAARAGRAITFISGPSATSDIELNRVEGVHGPRTLDVLIVEHSLTPG